MGGATEATPRSGFWLRAASSTRPPWTAANFFYSRFLPGGIAICHDYGVYEGVKKAIDEFLNDKPEAVIEYLDAMGPTFVIKQGS